MLRQPPRSALSPYTTLFRSRRMHRRMRERSAMPHSACTGGLLLDNRFRHYSGMAKTIVTTDDLDGSPDALCGIDRKSTRLNSSHSQISYAVFCLKKKTFNAQ